MPRPSLGSIFGVPDPRPPLSAIFGSEEEERRRRQHVPTPAEIARGAKPAIPQRGGGISTEKTIGIEVDGRHVVIPSIIKGVSYTPQAAFDLYRKGEVAPLGVFDTEEEATAFAEQRSRDLDKAFGGPGVLHKGPSAPAGGALVDLPDWQDISGTVQRNRKTGETRPKPIPGAAPGLDGTRGESPGLGIIATEGELAARRAGGKRALAAAGEAVASIADLPALAAKGLSKLYLPTGVAEPSFEELRTATQPGPVGVARRAVSAFDQRAEEQQLDALARAGAPPTSAALAETGAFGVGNLAAAAVPVDLGLGKVARLARGVRAGEEAALPAVRAAEEGVRAAHAAEEAAPRALGATDRALAESDAWAAFLRSKGIPDEETYYGLPAARKHLLDAQFEVSAPREPLPRPESVPETPPGRAAAPRAEFVTAKGSAYSVLDDGTTIRNKAPRPEHPGEAGPQPRSRETFYVSTEDAQKLGEVQAAGGPQRRLVTRGDHAAVEYLDGPDAGKVERRTVVPIQREPAAGLTPVELWGDAPPHFGNPIVEARAPGGPAVARAGAPEPRPEAVLPPAPSRPVEPLRGAGKAAPSTRTTVRQESGGWTVDKPDGSEQYFSADTYGRFLDPKTRAFEPERADALARQAAERYAQRLTEPPLEVEYGGRTFRASGEPVARRSPEVSAHYAAENAYHQELAALQRPVPPGIDPRAYRYFEANRAEIGAFEPTLGVNRRFESDLAGAVDEPSFKRLSRRFGGVDTASPADDEGVAIAAQIMEPHAEIFGSAGLRNAYDGLLREGGDPTTPEGVQRMVSIAVENAERERRAWDALPWDTDPEMAQVQSQLWRDPPTVEAIQALRRAYPEAGQARSGASPVRSSVPTPSAEGSPLQGTPAVGAHVVLLDDGSPATVIAHRADGRVEIEFDDGYNGIVEPDEIAGAAANTDLIDLYHGTSKEAAEQIRREGSLRAGRQFGGVEGVSLTPRREIAADFAGPDGEVLALRVPRSSLVPDAESFDGGLEEALAEGVSVVHRGDLPLPAAPEPPAVVREGLFAGQEEPPALPARPEPPLGPRRLPEPALESEPLPGMEPPPPGLTTGTKHAVTRAERLAAGLPEIENLARKDSETWAAAKEIFERDPEAPRTLAQLLAAKPRPISDVENDLLLHDRMQMTLDHRDALAAEDAALQAGDPEGIALARLRRQSIEQAKDANDRALDLGGSESGRALRARQKLIAEDYSPLNLVQRYRVANLGEEAPVPIRQKLTEISAQLEAAQARAVAAEERAQELEALRLIRSEQGAAAKAGRSGRRAASRQDLDAEYSALSQAFAKRAGTPRAGLDPELAALIAKMAKNRVRAGTTNLADLVDGLYQETKPYLAELEPRDVRDAIAGAGPSAQKAARSQAVSELAQVRREARVLNALDDARTRLASPRLPPATWQALEREAARWEGELERLQAGTAPLGVGPASDPQRLAAAKARAVTREAELRAQIASGEILPKGRAPVAADAELLNARAQVQGLKRQADTIILRREMANRDALEKGMDWTAGWGRFLKLTGTATLQKIAAAASERALVFKPVEEFIGAVLSKLPVVSKVAAKAPIEGGGSMSAIAKSYGGFFGEQARAEMRAGFAGRETPMELAFKSHAGYGEKVPAWMEYPGRVHTALKGPARVAGYQYAMEKQAQWYLGRGEAEELLNPLAQEEMKARAWEYATRDIFMGDNAAVRAFNKALGSEPGESLVAKGGKTAGRILFPIVKVPTNYALEVTDYALGLPKGMARLGMAVRQGLDELAPAEAELIMRQLKKGSLGAGLIALGATGVVEAGGYYEPGKHRREGEIQPGEVRIAGVTIPHMLLHHPAVEALQIGASLFRARTLAAGLGNAAWGVAEQVPFFEEPISAARTLRDDPSQFFGSIGRGMTIPPDVQRAARVLDQKKPRTPGEMAAQQAGWGGLSVDGLFQVPEIQTKKRKARGDFLEQLWEEEELGIPKLREGVR